MNSIECAICVHKNRNICNDISELLNRLNIPAQEQSVIWNMALKTVGCKRLKNLLFVLTTRQNKEILLADNSN